MAGAKKSSFPDMAKRLATALAILPGLYIVWCGGWALALLAGVAGAIMLFEAAQIARTKPSLWVMPTIIVVALMLTVLAVWIMAFDAEAARWIFIIALVITAADIGAFFAGRLIGGRKLAPKISPSKTWAGAVGGCIGGIVIALLAGVYYGKPAGMMAATGFIFAVLSIAGDLTESVFKRRFGAKDAGNLLPGHGGVLDRLDGYLFTMPALGLASTAGWL